MSSSTANNSLSPPQPLPPPPIPLPPPQLIPQSIPQSPPSPPLPMPPLPLPSPSLPPSTSPFPSPTSLPPLLMPPLPSPLRSPSLPPSTSPLPSPTLSPPPLQSALQSPSLSPPPTLSPSPPEPSPPPSPASAQSPSPPSQSLSDEGLPTETSKEQNNRSRILAYLDLGHEALLNKFHDNDTYSFSMDPKKLYLELQKRKSQICKLRLLQEQYDLVLPPTGDEVDTDKFDITLLVKLFVGLCGFEYPQKKWIPQESDVNDFANIIRIKHLRDQIYHLSKVSDTELKRIAPLFKPPLIALGIKQRRIDNISTLSIIDEVTKAKQEKWEKSQTNFSHNFIPPVDNFSSRDTELKILHEKMINLSGSKIGAVLSGFPGVGKSEIARKYCSMHRGKWYEDIIIWVNAQSEATMESDFQEISDECAIQKSKKEDGTYVERKKLVDLVFRHFAASLNPNPRKVLFVFDGADNVDALYEFLSASTDYSRFIIITSQCSNWDQRFDKLELDVFDDATTYNFFIENTTEAHYTNSEEIHQLLREISCHPLALQQAVSYITKNSITAGQYISLLGENKKEILSEEPVQIGNPSVNKTLTISIDRLEKINPEVKDFLGILSQLDGKEIKKGFLLMVFNNSILKLNKMLTLLKNYSIINFDTNTKSEFKDQIIQIHSLTQCFLESNLNHHEISNQLEKIANIFIKDLEDCEAKKLQDGKYWLNHFYKIYENEEKKPLFLENFLGNQNLILNLFETRGNPKKSLEIYQFISQHQKKKHGEDHPVYLDTTYLLAYCLSKQGQLKKALDLIKRSCEKSLLINGPLDPSHLNLESQLADCLMYNDQLDKACRLYQEVQQVQLKILGPEHSSYLTTKNNLALCYFKMNQLVEACQLYQEVQQTQFKVFGAKDSGYLQTKSNVAACYSKMGQLDKACELYGEVEQTQLKVLGPVHSIYLATKNNMAGCYFEINQLDKACELYEEVVQVQLEIRGAEDSRYLTTKSNLAACYSKRGQLDKACELYEEVEQTQLKVLGPENSSYLETKNELAICYLKMGQFVKARQMCQKVSLTNIPLTIQ